MTLRIDEILKNDTQHDDIQHSDTQHNDTQHNDTQHNDTQHNDTQHNDTDDIEQNDTQHNNTQDYVTEFYDTQHNDTQHNDTQRNVTQHNDTQRNVTQHNDTQHYDNKCCLSFILSVALFIYCYIRAQVKSSLLLKIIFKIHLTLEQNYIYKRSKKCQACWVGFGAKEVVIKINIQSKLRLKISSKLWNVAENRISVSFLVVTRQ